MRYGLSLMHLPIRIISIPLPCECAAVEAAIAARGYETGHEMLPCMSLRPLPRGFTIGHLWISTFPVHAIELFIQYKRVAVLLSHNNIT
jgi:hypothetical protein